MAWEKGTPSKTIRFLSLQISQRRQRGAALHNFLALFLIGNKVQPKIKSFNEKEQTQARPRIEMRPSHNPTSRDSELEDDSAPHWLYRTRTSIGHLKTPLFMVLHSKHFPPPNFPRKETHLGGKQLFHSMFEGAVLTGSLLGCLRVI